mmetsp:Transcript_51335/g.119318  ORF Transcript_51335/g.119318 Transcript_51335/m.119318 type:complete len:609 (-) Transcript_51335:68-1894(-)
MGNVWCESDKPVMGKEGDRRHRAEAWSLEDPPEAWGQRLCSRPGGQPAKDAEEAAARWSKPSGVFARCCTGGVPPDFDVLEREPHPEDAEQEVIDPMQIKSTAPKHNCVAKTASKASIDAADITLSPAHPDDAERAVSPIDVEKNTRGGIRWELWRPVLMSILMALVVLISSYAESWLPRGVGESTSSPSLESMLRYGTIPLIAAIIGYGTNVVALQMMFYPVEFVGCFPQLKIGCGLDMFLFGWQGVIPMKAEAMARLSVDLMTQKLIKVEEIFSRLDPERVSEEVADMLPDVVSSVINDAGRRHCPKLWEHMPSRVRKQLEDGVTAESKPMMARFIRDLQKHIADVFDLKACVIDVLVKDRQILNDVFLMCGAEEFEFIRVSGFYLGFFFGLMQMLVWMFVKEWWILPVCGVFVGYFTNVVALKIIFLPIEPIKLCHGKLTVQGLFLQRQREVSLLYAEQCAETILKAQVLMQALVSGPRSDKLFELVDKHVAACMEDQAGYYKSMFLVSIGSETWIDFRGGVCSEFRKRLPALLTKIQGYVQETLQLKDTLSARLQNLPPAEFERLLHAVFEQDEFKLILVGALLGAVVGFLQAVVQTPEQLGLR